MRLATASVVQAAARADLPAGTVAACAVGCGVIVANIYYAQPLLALIAPALGLHPAAAGLVVTLSQLGYAAGLLLVVPLADRVENRRLIVATFLLAAGAMAGVAASTAAAPFLLFAVLAGVVSAGAQVIVPFAAALTAPERRGRTVGNVMAGLLAGIMLARPAASAAAAIGGWRLIFWLAAAANLLFAGLLARALPARRPAARDGYGAILRSLGRLLATTPVLRRRAVYHALAFGIFNLFWTVVPLLLAREFGMEQRGIALFGLAGAAGALVAPMAGRLGDRGLVRAGTAAAIAFLLASCLLSGWAGATHRLWAVVLFALTLDGATQLNQVLGQRVIYALPGEAHGRMNAIYMTTVFVLGAGGALLGTASYHAGGWPGAMGAGAALALLFAAIFATERRQQA